MPIARSNNPKRLLLTTPEEEVPVAINERADVVVVDVVVTMTTKDFSSPETNQKKLFIN